VRTSGATDLTVAGVVARTDVHAPGMAPTAAAATGGGALTLAHRLAPHLTATARLDVARSFYAAGVTGFAALQATVAR
jgi:hypothetical protein